jgi:hypothetical protein
VLPAVAVARALGVLLAAQQLGLGFDGRVQVTSPTPLLAGASGELSLTILDSPSAVAPLSVRLSSAGVGLPETRLDEADVVDPQASQPRVRARYVAPAVAGRYEVQGLVEYVTCTEAPLAAQPRSSPGGAEGPLAAQPRSSPGGAEGPLAAQPRSSPGGAEGPLAAQSRSSPGGAEGPLAAQPRSSPGGAEGPRCRPRRARVVWVVQVLGPAQP